MERLSGWGAWRATVRGVARRRVTAMAIAERPAVFQENLGFIVLGCMSVSDSNY